MSGPDDRGRPPRRPRTRPDGGPPVPRFRLPGRGTPPEPPHDPARPPQQDRAPGRGPGAGPARQDRGPAGGDDRAAAPPGRRPAAGGRPAGAPPADGPAAGRPAPGPPGRGPAAGGPPPPGRSPGGPSPGSALDAPSGGTPAGAPPRGDRPHAPGPGRPPGGGAAAGPPGGGAAGGPPGGGAPGGGAPGGGTPGGPPGGGAAGGSPGGLRPSGTRVAPVEEPTERVGAEPGAGRPGLPEPLRALLRRLPEGRSARARLALGVVAALLLVLSGGTALAAHSVDSSLTRADIVPTSLSGVIGGGENILLLGLDTRTDAKGDPLPADLLAQLHAGASDSGGDSTDTIMVLHIPAGGGAATGFSIPRDSYVDLPDDFGKHKINSAYAYGQNAAKDRLSKQGVKGADLATQSATAGAQTTVETVGSLTGLGITHVGIVNLAGFAEISSAVGGVPVCLNKAVDDDFSGAKLPAGEQKISGPQALAFVRQRHGLPGGDLDRVRRQQVFLSAMAHQVLSADTLTSPSTFSPLLDAVSRAVTVDQSWGVLGLATQLQAVSSGSVKFQTIPIVKADYDAGDDGEAVEVDPQQVQKFVADPTSGSDAPTTSAAPAPTRSASPRASGSRSAAPAPAASSSAPEATAPTVPCVN